MDTITRVLKKSDPMKDFMDGYNITDCIPMDYMRLREDALKPTRGSEDAAGYDLYVPQYENGIGIPAHETRLIDSIGTQMHIDNGVTREQIINMFNTLKQYGLPIEITEFDMAMISNVEGLSEEEIKNLRIQKEDVQVSAATLLRTISFGSMVMAWIVQSAAQMPQPMQSA